MLNPDRSSCGVGFLAQKDGIASHDIIRHGLQSLTCLTHRGGVASDGKTSDGCGVLLQLPDKFLRAVALSDCGIQLPDTYGVGNVFLSIDESEANHQRQLLEKKLKECNLEPVGWRKVPVNPDVCGELARQSMPHIEQVFVAIPEEITATEAEPMLYTARRLTEQHMDEDAPFYVCSLSTQLLVYKGLLMPAALSEFYTDLADERLVTSICLFHQRFSTNTLPHWQLAHPFRMIIHNGEVNTILGNINWAHARHAKMRTDRLPRLQEIGPAVNVEFSDSCNLDRQLELLINGGLSPEQAVRLLIPAAWENDPTMAEDLKAYFSYESMHIEPWDGPTAVILCDGQRVICVQDRNGLRPMRYQETDDGYIMACSETGLMNPALGNLTVNSRLGPGEMVLIDTSSGHISSDKDIANRVSRNRPYADWLKQIIEIKEDQQRTAELLSPPFENLLPAQKQFQLFVEEQEKVLIPMAQNGQETVGSMGDDTPLAVLSKMVRPLYDYFRQRFAQVTNPAIDSLRETLVMSLTTVMGKEENIFAEDAMQAKRLVLKSPVLSPSVYMTLSQNKEEAFRCYHLDATYNPDTTCLTEALQQLCDEAETAAREGYVMLIVDDRNFSRERLPIQGPLAIGALHQHLLICGLRCDTNLIAVCGCARDPHHIAVLIGLGATAVYPWLGFITLEHMRKEERLSATANEVAHNYCQGLDKGLKKILSKMGISCISSYRGAQLFEAVGLANEVVERCCPGMDFPIEGANFATLQKDYMELSEHAWQVGEPVNQGGLYRFVYGNESHAFNPDTVALLHDAVNTGDYEKYQSYAKHINEREILALRDMLSLKLAPSALDISKVEPIESLFQRFDSAGMSLGALSPEAHQSLATAMNTLGGRSNSGEGGEDPARYGTIRSSKIKQVASGRFGVTPHYLVNAEVLQIKIAQGAKPGEGGQLPGIKVNQMIARLRHSKPGVTLISPPPHHDIYSIEDLAQLIFDLKQVNPDALVSVKLVSEPGVGVVAIGVVKAYADLITISGHDGGTAASPITSIRYAGTPWELGLSETHRMLCDSGLRERVVLQTDGGLKTGLDVIKAAILGAESFGFGTTPMVALGCKYLRICHLNNCATGVATQHQVLREKHFTGTAEKAMNFFRFIARETQEWLSKLGVSSIEDIIGRTELLEKLPGTTEKQKLVNLEAPLRRASGTQPMFCRKSKNDSAEATPLAQRIMADTKSALAQGKSATFNYDITNTDRAIGASLSGAIARKYGAEGVVNQPLHIHLKGSAGSSLGAWNAPGLHIRLIGDANDYLAKGIAGGSVVVAPPAEVHYPLHTSTIMGNTCLYGATGGIVMAAGRGGERFAVRNSGALAIAEGSGHHCCEYMTGGGVVMLGRTGNNFGAGMTGGYAYVLDEEEVFQKCFNPEFINTHPFSDDKLDTCRQHLKKLVTWFVAETASPWGQEILANFDSFADRCFLVLPRSENVSHFCDNILQLEQEAFAPHSPQNKAYPANVALAL